MVIQDAQSCTIRMLLVRVKETLSFSACCGTCKMEESMTEDELRQSIEEELQKKIGIEMSKRMKQEQAVKVQDFKTLNRYTKKGAILFTGSSLMEQFPVCEIAASAGIKETIYNRGIGGTTTEDFLREIDTVLLDLEPSKVFLNIGTNDMNSARFGPDWMDRLEKNYERILSIAKEKLPETEIYCMAYYPANCHMPDASPWQIAMTKDRTPENLAKCDAFVEKLAKRYGYRYIDVNNGLYNDQHEQKLEFAKDGVHMYVEAYEIIFNNLKPYILSE